MDVFKRKFGVAAHTPTTTLIDALAHFVASNDVQRGQRLPLHRAWRSGIPLVKKTKPIRHAFDRGHGPTTAALPLVLDGADAIFVLSVVCGSPIERRGVVGDAVNWWGVWLGVVQDAQLMVLRVVLGGPRVLPCVDLGGDVCARYREEEEEKASEELLHRWVS